MVSFADSSYKKAVQFSASFVQVLAHLSKSNSRTFQGPYEGYIRRTKLHQTGTFISIYKHHKLTQRGHKFYAHLRPERSHLEHLFQYQLVCSRRFRKSNSSTFKDLQTQIQELSRTGKSPVC